MLLASQVRALALVLGDLTPRATLPCFCSLPLPGFQKSGLGFFGEPPKYDDEVDLPFIRRLLTERCIEKSDRNPHCDIEARDRTSEVENQHDFVSATKHFTPVLVNGAKNPFKNRVADREGFELNRDDAKTLRYHSRS